MSLPLPLSAASCSVCIMASPSQLGTRTNLILLLFQNYSHTGFISSATVLLCKEYQSASYKTLRFSYLVAIHLMHA